MASSEQNDSEMSSSPNSHPPPVKRSSSDATMSDNAADKWRLKIKTPSLEKEVEIDEDAHVNQLRQEVSRLFEQPAERLCLVYGRKIMKDEESIKSYGVKNHASIHVVPSRNTDAPSATSLSFATLTSLVGQTAPAAAPAGPRQPSPMGRLAGMNMDQRPGSPFIQNMVNNPEMIPNVVSSSPQITLDGQRTVWRLEQVASSSPRRYDFASRKPISMFISGIPIQEINFVDTSGLYVQAPDSECKAPRSTPQLPGRNSSCNKDDSADSFQSAHATVPGARIQEGSLWCDKCGQFLEEPCWEHVSHIKDQHFNMALSTLPDSLIVQQREGMTEKGVFAIIPVPLQTKFGPLDAPIGDEPSRFAIPDATTNAQYFQLTSDTTANWMKFVRFAEGTPDQNLAVYLKGSAIYFISVKHIATGDELRVGYSKKYTDSVGHWLPAVPQPELPQTVASKAEEDEMEGCEDEEMVEGSEDDEIEQDDDEVSVVQSESQRAPGATMRAVRAAYEEAQRQSTSAQTAAERAEFASYEAEDADSAAEAADAVRRAWSFADQSDQAALKALDAAARADAAYHETVREATRMIEQANRLKVSADKAAASALEQANYAWRFAGVGREIAARAADREAANADHMHPGIPPCAASPSHNEASANSFHSAHSTGQAAEMRRQHSDEAAHDLQRGQESDEGTDRSKRTAQE